VSLLFRQSRAAELPLKPDFVKTAYIGLGSNLGDSLQVLQQAWKTLGEQPGIHLAALSGPYRTEPVGMISNHRFINAAGALQTTLPPGDLLQTLLQVENLFGRIRSAAKGHYQDRILDFDLLLYDDILLEQGDLVVPHPELQRRLFVLYPLSEIAPEYAHPGLQRTVAELLAELVQVPDQPGVEKVSWPLFAGNTAARDESGRFR
jgi:2-amino-4-hydroxy-6-hydroxymethyldihydropteridine diphosphokinase